MRAKLRPMAEKPERAIRVLSYNVLAQSLVNRDFYPTNGAAIKWATRFPALREELIHYDPDILFLQEVDVAKMKAWGPLLESAPLNLEYVFFNSPPKKHGVIVAYKRASMVQIDTLHLEYDALEEPPRQSSTLNSGAVMVVETSDSKTRLVLGTTHLYWHPHADYERLRQLRLFLGAVLSMKEKHDAAGVILGCDLNSTPDSPAYEFLRDGKLTAEATEAVKASARTSVFSAALNDNHEEGRSTMIEDADNAVAKLNESIASFGSPCLTSCYAHLTGEPAFTNWTTTFRETIDYLLVSNEITPRAVLALPLESELGPEPNSLPREWDCGGYPSDHLVLAADVELISESTGALSSDDFTQDPKTGPSPSCLIL